MKKRQAFTLIELLVVISIIALLVSILMPALSKARAQARAVVCLTNTHGFGVGFILYADDWDGYIVPFANDNEDLWADQLIEYQGEDLRFCPEAAKPPAPEPITGEAALGWVKEYWYWKRSSEKPATRSSYGMNGWAHRPTGNTWGWAPEDHWGKIFAKNPTEVPLALDCMWADGYPCYSSVGPKDTQYETIMAALTRDYPPMDEIGRFCLDRHSGSVNGCFMDGSARAIPLEDLWTLRWHRSYQPNYDIVIPWLN